MHVDAVALAQELIRFETVNPPGAEEACAEHLARVLEPHRFTLERYEHEPTRTNLVARRPGTERSLAPLVFTGHLDTVPLGQQPWSVPPFAGEIHDGRLYGRGSSDMKDEGRGSGLRERRSGGRACRGPATWPGVGDYGGRGNRIRRRAPSREAGRLG